MAELQDGTFADEVYRCDQPTLVEFWAPWCKPCAFLQPVLEEAARLLEGSVKFVKLNVDENPIAATMFSVKSVPTMILFRGENELYKVAGFVGRDELVRHIRDALRAESERTPDGESWTPEDGGDDAGGG